MEYMGFWVTWIVIQAINKKLEANVKTTSSENQGQVSFFTGLVKYSGNMWEKRSHLLQPLTALTSNKIKFKWTVFKQKAFD